MYHSRPRRANIVDRNPSICSTTKAVYLVPLSCTRDARMHSNFSISLMGEISNGDGTRVPSRIASGGAP